MSSPVSSVEGALPFAYNPSGYNFLVVGHESMCKVIESKSDYFKPGDIVVPIVRRPGDYPNCLIGRPDNCSDGNKHEAGITGLHGFMRERNEDEEVGINYGMVSVNCIILGILYTARYLRQNFLISSSVIVWCFFSTMNAFTFSVSP